MRAVLNQMPQLHNKCGRDSTQNASADGDLPAGSGLLIACSLGLSGWYGIARLVAWLSHSLT